MSLDMMPQSTSLVSTIQFDIHDFKSGISESFMVEATEDNYEKVLQHRFTRNIQFTKEFRHQFEREMSIPVEFINPMFILAVYELKPHLFSM